MTPRTQEEIEQFYEEIKGQGHRFGELLEMVGHKYNIGDEITFGNGDVVVVKDVLIGTSPPKWEAIYKLYGKGNDPEKTFNQSEYMLNFLINYVAEQVEKGTVIECNFE